MTIPKLTREKVKGFLNTAVEVLKKRWWIILIELALLAVILVADQLSKKYVMDAFAKYGDPYEVMPGFITLTYSENSGAGFGMLKNSTVALTVMTIIVVIVILGYLAVAQKQTMWLRIPLIMIAAGGIGNSIDRVELGYVRDFIQFSFLKHFQYIFNVADSFVTVGAFMLVIVLIVMLVREGNKNKKEFEAEQAKKGSVEENAIDPLDAPKNMNPMLSSPNTYTFAEPSEADKQATENRTDGSDLSDESSDVSQDRLQEKTSNNGENEGGNAFDAKSEVKAENAEKGDDIAKIGD